MTTISLRLDDDMKKELEEMCDSMGMSLTTFFMIYAKKALRERKIPFEISAPVEPFHSEKNQNQIRKADAQVKAGNIVVKSIEELEDIAKS